MFPLGSSQNIRARQLGKPKRSRNFSLNLYNCNSLLHKIPSFSLVSNKKILGPILLPTDTEEEEETLF